ncbi:MAG: STAS domain-containing protein [Spirochaetales bacterium]|nr:STAS domain-containing protein [Spirochaetales bacterium]
MNEGKYQFAECETFYLIKMSGNLKYTGSGGFDTFVENIFSRIDNKSVVIDLTESLYLDSTNLGILAKIADTMLSKFEKKTTIISSNPDITTLLTNIGFDDFFTILDESPVTETALSDISEMVTGDRGLALMMLEAHKALMELNDKNKSVFSSVVSLLQKEVEKEE